MKPASADKYEDWLVELVAKEYTESTYHAEEYLKILYDTKVGREKIKQIAEKYGTELKLITKLKLGV
jgi:disulfide oxidoreductase YuzD